MLCIVGALFFFYSKNGNLKACFYVSSSLVILFLCYFPLFPSSPPAAFLTFSFLFGITKLERWVFYFLLFFPFILLSLLMTTEKKKYWKNKKNSPDPFLCITASCPF